MSAVEVTPVRTRTDLTAFVDLPLRLHPRDRYVPLAVDALRRWHSGTGPHTRYGRGELLLARDPGGQVVGRTTVHSDDRMDARLGQMTTLLGATEFADAAVLEGLVAAAEDRSRAEGRTGLLGPVSLLPNQTGGVITSGFEHRGFVDSAWNPSYYPAAWESLGFTRTWTGATWICEDLAGADPDVFGTTALPDGVQLHRASRRHLGDQLAIVRRMLNASFAELGYYTPISAEELEVQTDGLAWILDESLVLYLTDGDEPVAFVLVIPDLTGFVQSTGGRLRPWDQARLLLTRRRYRRDAILVIKGTVPSARGRGLMRHLSRQLLVNLQAGGYRTLRVTFIEDGNAGSAAQFRAMGGRALHGTTFYRRAVR